MGDGGFSQDDEKFCFGEVQLEVVLGHPGRDVCEAGRKNLKRILNPVDEGAQIIQIAFIQLAPRVFRDRSNALCSIIYQDRFCHSLKYI